MDLHILGYDALKVLQRMVSALGKPYNLKSYLKT